jgi:hypothetical protein
VWQTMRVLLNISSWVITSTKVAAYVFEAACVQIQLAHRGSLCDVS